jgi:hypothetical protein
MAREIHRHKEVVGSDGAHIATLDQTEGAKWIALTKDDPAGIGTHHIVPIKWVDRMDSKVPPNKASGGTMSQWQTVELTASDVIQEPGCETGLSLLHRAAAAVIDRGWPTPSRPSPMRLPT